MYLFKPCYNNDTAQRESKMILKSNLLFFTQYSCAIAICYSWFFNRKWFSIPVLLQNLDLTGSNDVYVKSVRNNGSADLDGTIRVGEGNLFNTCFC